MSSNCKATTGFANDCTDLRRAGGSDKTCWFGYLSELDTRFSLDQNTNITAIDFGSYGGLRRLDGFKFSNSFGDELQIGQGGNKSYKHTVSLKLFPSSTADDVILQSMAMGDDLFFIMQDSNRKFYILGGGNGLTAISDLNNTGETGESDIRDTIVFEGSEQTKKLRFEISTYAQTLAYITSFEI